MTALDKTAGNDPVQPFATILCVEDEVDLRSDIAEELMSAGYRVIEAGNGREAMAMLATARPDLILCDITMPGLGGYAFMAQLRAERPDLAEVPFIFLTALADRTEVLHGKRAGADDYLVKPVDFDDLLATIGARLRFVERVRAGLLAELEAEKRRLIDKALREGEGTLAALAAAFDRVAVGLFLIDEASAVRLVNEAGRALAESRDGLVLSTAGLAARAPASARQLRGAIADLRQAGEGARLVPIEREEGRPLVLQLSMVAVPGGNARHVLVLVVDPDRQPEVPPETLMTLFGCTATEARIAAALAAGKRLEEIGEAFGIKPTTVTFHLQNLFQKTRTNRQVDLMALLIRATAPLVL
ncbi:response regulator [Ancylobacter amanitiformis]|uniref:DNA-binding response OmpR family regulator/DNA-binding CsgD family transcriptional regulator n=1 Tax=Ancylobacter amanitiformis TaxID=217069 RepID=A0ABU0LLM2_9HYPH|nr:response regulator [Ancylobacter amanitiformis]MDQ0509606.1 DNA-binding response OmpR family regulator/DNA-binding CsgD family transcriptional regulator [Ancylobacter amanitiformis]